MIIPKKSDFIQQNRNVLYGCDAAQICKDWSFRIMGVKLQYLPPEVAKSITCCEIAENVNWFEVQILQYSWET